MKSLFKLCFIILTLAFLTSCSAGQMSLKNMDTIRKGMTKDEFDLATGTKKEKFAFEYNINNETYQVYIYNLNLSTLALNKFLTGANGLLALNNAPDCEFSFGIYSLPSMPSSFPMDNMMYMHNSYSSGPPITDYSNGYAFIFKQDSLLYWGYFEELIKHTNEVISELGDKSEKDYTKILSEQENKKIRGRK